MSLALMAALAMILAAAAPALAESPENTIRGFITDFSRSAEVVLVEEDPSDESGSAKGEFAVTGQTEILEGRGGKRVSFENLQVGQIVEATYAGPVAESYPTQGTAGRIVILGEDQADTPAALLETGGASLPVLGVLLIAGGLLVRRAL
jgi:hypothetical protein